MVDYRSEYRNRFHLPFLEILIGEPECSIKRAHLEDEDGLFYWGR